MTSLAGQNLKAAEAKLRQVQLDLGWPTFLRNPRERIGVEQMPAIIMVDGGSPAPGSLTGGVADDAVQFSTAVMAAEKAGADEDDRVEALLDLGFVRISNALLDPDDIQLGGLATGVFREEVSDPIYGRPDKGAQWFGGQTHDWRIEFMGREGDAEAVGP